MHSVVDPSSGTTRMIHLIRRWRQAIMDYPLVSGPLRFCSLKGVFPQYLRLHLPVAHRFVVKIDRNRSFIYHRAGQLDSLAYRIFWWQAFGFEPETSWVIARLTQTRSTFLDIGGFTGFYTTVALTLNPTIRTWTFEPSPRLFPVLTRNIQENGFEDRAVLINRAVCDTQSTASLFMPRDVASSMSTLSLDEVDGEQGEIVEVETMRLDDMFPLEHPVELIKVDVEGCEDLVMRGARAILQNQRPVWIIETQMDGPNDELNGIITEHSYRPYHLLPEGPVLSNAIIPDPSRRYLNYLLLPEESAGQVLSELIR